MARTGPGPGFLSHIPFDIKLVRLNSHNPRVCGTLSQLTSLYLCGHERAFLNPIFCWGCRRVLFRAPKHFWKSKRMSRMSVLGGGSLRVCGWCALMLFPLFLVAKDHIGGWSRILDPPASFAWFLIKAKAGAGDREESPALNPWWWKFYWGWGSYNEWED